MSNEKVDHNRVQRIGRQGEGQVYMDSDKAFGTGKQVRHFEGNIGRYRRESTGEPQVRREEEKGGHGYSKFWRSGL